MLLQALTFVQSRFVREEGATMVEYGLIIAVIAAIVVVGALALGNATNTKFGEMKTCVESVLPDLDCP